MTSQNIKFSNLIPNFVITLIILAMPLYFFRFTVLGIPTNVFEVVLYVAFLAWLLYRFRQPLLCPPLSKGRGGRGIDWRLPWVVWAWLAVGLIGALVNPDVLSGLGFWRAYFFDGALIYILVANEFDVSKNVVPRALVAVGGIVSLISLLSFTGWHVAGDGRWLGWFGFDEFASPNYLSLFLAPIATASILAMFVWRGVWRYVAIVSTLVTVIALWGSQSRGALVGIVGGLIIAAIWYATRKKSKYIWLIWSALVLCVILTATYFVAKPDAAAAPDAGRVATSNNIRWEIWRTSTEIVEQKPILGAGLGNYQNYFTELTKSRVNYPEFISPLALTAHNFYLHILATLGIVGLAIFIWWLTVIIKSLSNEPRPTEMTVIVAAFASILFYGLVDTPYFKNDLAILWWILAAIIMVYGTKKTQS